MPVAKKTRRKTPIKLRAKAEAASPLPDLRAMESFLAAMTRSHADDASEKAQDLVYAAWEETSPRKRVALARKALSVSPLCADALNILAEAAGSATASNRPSPTSASPARQPAPSSSTSTPGSFQPSRGSQPRCRRLMLSRAPTRSSSRERRRRPTAYGLALSETDEYGVAVLFLIILLVVDS